MYNDSIHGMHANATSGQYGLVCEQRDHIPVECPLYSRMYRCNVSFLSCDSESDCIQWYSLLTSFPLEANHAELLRSIGVTVILNCIRTFVPEAASNEDYYGIVELCFLYLLRLFVSDTNTVIQANQEQVSELLHFLYEALFSPYYLQSGQGVQTIPGAVIQLEVHSQDMILSDYVMSLFALLYYNCINF